MNGARFRLRALGRSGHKDCGSWCCAKGSRGGVSGFKTYGFLREARQKAAPPKDLRSCLLVDDAEVRASIVETSANLPVKDTLPVLQRAARSSGLVVRQKVIK